MKRAYVLISDAYGTYHTVYESRLEAFARADLLNAHRGDLTGHYDYFVIEKDYKESDD